MAVPLFLGFSALLWLLYGVLCFVQPGYLADGGLQAAIGLLAGLALVRPALRRPALVTLASLCAGLGLSRLLGTIVTGEVSGYTGVARGLEIGPASVAAWCLAREPG